MADALEIVAAKLRLGMLHSEDLPGLAVDAILAGYESISLYQLAGMTSGDLSDARDLAQAALDELGIAEPSEDDALWTMVRVVAQEAVDGVRSPIDAAQWIAGARWRVKEEGDLRVFVGLAYALDDGDGDPADIEREALAAADELLARHSPRRWVQLCAVAGESPLWRYDGGQHVSVDRGGLGLSASLLTAVSAWSTTFEACADGFDSQEDAERFVVEGQRLVQRLQGELGDGWHVEYRPEPTRPPGLKLRRRSGVLGTGLARRFRRR